MIAKSAEILNKYRRALSELVNSAGPESMEAAKKSALFLLSDTCNDHDHILNNLPDSALEMNGDVMDFKLVSSSCEIEVGGLLVRIRDMKKHITLEVYPVSPYMDRPLSSLRLLKVIGEKVNTPSE